MDAYTDKICALATPYGTSALAVIRATGAGSIAGAAELFSRPETLNASPGGRVLHGFLVEPGTGIRIDEVTIIVWRAPASYTGQDTVEILCHGSVSGIRRVLGLLQNAGFRPADPGEFTLRAFLSGKLDLTEAEAVHELVTSRTGRAHALALHRLSGGVSRIAQDVRRELIAIAAGIEIQLDYPEDEIGPITLSRDRILDARRKLITLASAYETGRLYHDGVRVALAGRTNAGKSSLFNLFVREDRAIVSEHHGTTRDYLEVETELDGVPVRLFDTAGLRQSEEALETEGIRRSGMVMEQSSLILYVYDSTVPIEPEEVTALERLRPERKIILVRNKIDLLPETPSWSFAQLTGRLHPALERYDEVPVSAVTGEGFSRLLQVMKAAILPSSSDHDTEVVVESHRQKLLLDRGVEALSHVLEGVDSSVPLDLVTLDLQDALNALGELTGEIYSDEILDAMFSQFCVGK